MPLTFVTGALAPAVFGLNLWWSMIAIVLGNVVGALFMALYMDTNSINLYGGVLCSITTGQTFAGHRNTRRPASSGA